MIMVPESEGAKAPSTDGQFRQALMREWGRFADMFQRQHWALQLASVVGGIAATAVIANAVFTTSAYAPALPSYNPATPYGFGMEIAGRARTTNAVVPPTEVAPTEGGNAPKAFSVGDINKDGKVDSIDYSVMLEHFDEDYPPADLDNNGVVDSLDMATLLANWSW